MMLFPDAKLIIFCKAPVAGVSKTRLIPALGAEGAAELQRRMSQHIINMALDAQLADIELQCYPDSSHPFFLQLLDQQCIELNRQQGDDLGERMRHALEKALSQYRYAMVIGTDAPILDAVYLMAAFQQLVNGRDVVLGPAEDGGYVLLGLSTFEPTLFQNIAWSSDRVYRQTCERIRQSGLSLHEMDSRWDIDEPSDLIRLQQTPALCHLLHSLQTDPEATPSETQP